MTKAELRMMTDDELAAAAAQIQAEQDERYRAEAIQRLMEMGDTAEEAAEKTR